MKKIITGLTLSCAVLFSSNCFAAHHQKTQNCDINIKDRKFTSGSLKRVSGEKCKFQLKAGKKHRLTVCNLDKVPAEFESRALKIEKIIKGGSSVKIRIKPLEKGKTYKFEEEFGEYHCEFKGI